MHKWTLTGKKALVTGGTKGIGQATALELLALGAEVGIVARNAAEVEQLVAEWQGQGYQVWGIAADLVRPDDRGDILEAIQGRWDHLDILVNNVGTNIRKAFTEYDSTEYRHIFDTNLTSAMGLTQSLFPLLEKAGKGSVINVASVAGMVDVRSGAPYGMTKAALIQMSRHLAVEWAPFGIRVNTVSPWYTRTPLAEPVLQQPDRLQHILDRTPLGRIAEAEEVAAAIAFLAMDGAGYITGHNLVVDGGMTVQGL